jgi:hypothetical protein
MRALRVLFALVLVAGLAYAALKYLRSKPGLLSLPMPGLPSPSPNKSGAPGAGAAETPLNRLPEMPVKPRPVNVAFRGCPPEGDGGDRAMNRLKNRVDEGDYVPVAFAAILRLDWPKRIESLNRDRWNPEEAAAIAHYEGVPVAVEGYLAKAKQSGPESCNCHGADNDMRDFHLFLTAKADGDRTRSIVVEPTPALRAKHAGWTLRNFNEIVREKKRVRLSGWLLFDAEHPEQIGKTRGTIWEIHPLMKVEVKQFGMWTTLD